MISIDTNVRSGGKRRALLSFFRIYLQEQITEVLATR